MKSAATIFAAVASMGLVSACATANGQTSNESSAPMVASASEADGERHMRVRVRRGGRGGAKSVIANYDKDEDGRISRDEYHGQPNRGRFAKLDADEDGFIDQAELEADMAERRERRAERRAERGERWAERGERWAERAERHAERAKRHAERYKGKILEQMDRNGDGEVNGEDFDFDFNFEFDEEGFEKRMQEHRARALKKMDSNDDGVVSREEFTARHDQRFDKMDKDGNGALSADELKGMALLRGMMPDFKRFGMGRHAAPGDQGDHMFIWRDNTSDGDDDEESGEAEE